ncbi:Phosphate carrier protein, mitochondrial [Collichthys lucidus]|uniref:Solute carrier family 25 member 3 n=1 Tax=Collichthys lucidus TaxID=240159 RepID=A0A4U5VRF3_COLLU|nr:Phosphate carrier protein, mitochondrial [Collichthys lucidus]
MYPTALTQLARANPFSAPLFSLQKVEEPQQSVHGQRQTRRLAAAATADDSEFPPVSSEMSCPYSLACVSSEGDSCEFGSQKYFVLCGFGGILSCGTTHTAVVPLDLVKCRMQTAATLVISTSCEVKPVAACEEGNPLNTNVSCEFGSNKYYALCGFGGILSCGITHTAVVPLDLVKCRLQVDPDKYKSIGNGFSVTVREDGVRGLAKGWAPTFIGYSMQGLCKFGFYEVFKIFYSDLLGEENTYLWRTSLYLAASASAEFFADIALAPMEAVKVRIQTQPGYANTLRECVPKMYGEEGIWAFYKGVVPLWMRQIPYTMMKFACFERTVEMLYKYVVPKPRSECSKGEQLVVTFVAGYIAGVFCAIVSHPADSVVSVLNKEKGSTAVQVLKRLGPKGVWKGLVARIIMIGTLTALQWFIYDSVKVYFRLPRPPPPEMPESLKKKLGLTE